MEFQSIFQTFKTKHYNVSSKTAVLTIAGCVPAQNHVIRESKCVFVFFKAFIERKESFFGRKFRRK